MLLELRESVRIAAGALRANVLRATLTTLGIVIGITTVTLMGTLIEGLNNAFLDSISSFGRDVIYVDRFDWGGGRRFSQFRNRKAITVDEADALRAQLRSARAVVPIVQRWGVTLTSRDQSIANITAIGSSEQYDLILGADITAGRFYTAAEAAAGRPVAVIGYNVAHNLFAAEDPLGRQLRIGTGQFDVVGVIAKQGTMLGMFSLDDRVVVPLKAYDRQIAQANSIEIAVKAADPDDVDNTRYEIQGVFRKIRGRRPGMEDDFALNQAQQFEQQTAVIRGSIYAGGLAIAALALIVGGIGIMNIMFVSVTERTHEIGIRKALGARARTIRAQFLIEAAMLCLIGGLLGLGLASAIVPGVKYGFDLSFLPITVPPLFVGIGVAVSVSVGLVAGFLPAWKAARMDPVDALRYE